MADVYDYSTTPAANNAAPPNGWPEGMQRSDVNDTARQHYADIASMLRTFPWMNLAKVSITRNSATQFQFNGVDVTAFYLAGRRIRQTGATTAWGRIISSSFSAGNTIVNVENDLAAAVPTSLTACEVSVVTLEGDNAGKYFLGTRSISAAANLDITSVISSGFDEYEITLQVAPANTGKTLAMRISSDNGSSFRAAAADYAYAGIGLDSGVGALNYGTASDNTQFLISAPAAFAGKLLSNLTNAVFALRILYLGDGSFGRFNALWEASYYNDTASVSSIRGGGISSGAVTAMNALRFRMADGSNWSGTARIYGIKK